MRRDLANRYEKGFKIQRARCVLWIKDFLIASKDTIERRLQYRRDSRGRFRKRWTLVVVEEWHVVVLEGRKGENVFEFITAFPADEAYIAKIQRESALMETKKSSVLTATEAQPRS